jgi:hypothetical protein
MRASQQYIRRASKLASGSATAPLTPAVVRAVSVATRRTLSVATPRSHVTTTR